MIAWIAICEAANPGKDPHPSDHVFQVVDPVFEFLGAFHVHADNCSPPTTVRQSAGGDPLYARGQHMLGTLNTHPGARLELALLPPRIHGGSV